jgi:Bacterial capsule synthesis protein PGA_cap
MFHPNDCSCTPIVFGVVQVTSPHASGLFLSDPALTEPARVRVRRQMRRRLGIGLGVVSLTALAVGGAISSAAAEVQAERVTRSAALLPAFERAIQSAQEEEATEPPPVAPDGPVVLAPTTSTETWSVMVGGDSLLTRSSGGVNPFERQSPLMRSADLSIVNVETAISDSQTRVPKEYNFKSPAKFADYMAEAGIDVGSLANNHSMDFGDQGMIDTIDALREAGVDAVGAGVNRSAALKPSMHMIKGLKVAVIGASQVIPDPSWVATDSSIGVAAAGKDLSDDDTTVLKTAIRNAKKDADVVIVIMHWGVEKDVCPTDLQQRTAAVLHEAGAALVVGAHPHVLQPIVRSADDLTAYSLGNFIWDPRGGLSADTGILEVNFTGPKISGVTFHPHRLDAQGWAVPAKNPGDQARILAAVSRDCS